MARLDSHPGEVIDRGRRLSFQLDGKTFQAYPGDTIAAALLASGVHVFSRSFKYHRPRGLLCASGNCPNCLMNVNGVPNERVCTRLVRDGDRVTSQHCWPSLRWDVFSLVELLDFALTAGFYYKTLIRPRFLWKLAEPIIRRMAGLGTLSPDSGADDGCEYEHLSSQVTVVGGGPAGLAAALAAAEAGAEVVLIDDQRELGGHLLHQRRELSDLSSGKKPGYEIGRDLANQLAGTPRVTVLKPALAFGAYEGNLLGVVVGKRLIHLRTDQLVVATGSYEYPTLFGNNDLPGVMLSSAVLKLIHLYRVKVGEKAVVVTSDEEGLATALDLHWAGIEVAAVVDRRREVVDSEGRRELERLKIPYLVGFAPICARGRSRVCSLVVAPWAEGPPVAQKLIPCDLICLCASWSPAVELLRQCQGDVCFDPDSNQMVPGVVPPNLTVAGHLTGRRDLPAILRQGRLAGLEASSRLRPLESLLRDELQKLRTQTGSNRNGGGPAERPLSFPIPAKPKQFICLCEDVTRKDVVQSVAEGFDEMELLKRYTTAAMGPCQGRMCLMPLAHCCAEETGETLVKTGTTTSRPLIRPVSLSLLGGPHHHPFKYTPMHHKHVEAGARQMDMGEWKRPHTYQDPELEWRAVRQAVGLIDVSTLGKLELRGRDAGRLLDLVYTHQFSTLKVSRVRYGVICGEDGIIRDDGTVSRLAEDTFYITTTTGNVEFVQNWLEWWEVTMGFCSHVTNVTGDYAAVNLAGPKARALLEKVTEVDLSPEGFRYMACRRGEVAGVPALLLRIGFVGETGWEIHYPSCYGEYLWETLLEVGEGFGIRPFGVEAQRILRLEKKHLIVGQDTDALSNPLESDMEWVVKFEKEDFVGKATLEAIRAEGFRNRLVGFVSEGLVKEGCAVVVDHKPVGRVTSARISPAQNRCVGMAWVPHRYSSDGTTIYIVHRGRTFPAQVHQAPFYDPIGTLLRS